MRLNGELAYEKLGNDLYLSLNDEIYLLDNEVSIYIFELLKTNVALSHVKEKVLIRFADSGDYSNEEKEKYITEFISDLINNQILLQDQVNR